VQGLLREEEKEKIKAKWTSSISILRFAQALAFGEEEKEVREK